MRAFTEDDLGAGCLDHDLLTLECRAALKFKVALASIARKIEVERAWLVIHVEALDFRVDNDDRLGRRVEGVLRNSDVFRDRAHIINCVARRAEGVIGLQMIVLVFFLVSRRVVSRKDVIFSLEWQILSVPHIAVFVTFLKGIGAL